MTQFFLDDIVVTEKPESEPLNNLDKLRMNLRLQANKQKSFFYHAEIEYCGHKIDKEGLHKSEKIDPGCY